MSVSLNPIDGVYACAECGIRLDVQDEQTLAPTHERIQPGTFAVVERCPGSRKPVVQAIDVSGGITAVLWQINNVLRAVTNATNEFTVKLAAQASNDLLSKWQAIMGQPVRDAVDMWARLSDWLHYQPRSGVDRVALERIRQVVRGHVPEQDATDHADGSLVRAAICYAVEPQTLGFADVYWPWAEEDYKPSPADRIRELTIAAALLVAEIDRLQYLREVGDVDKTTDTSPQGPERN